jgi:dihydroneopterin aldolase
MRTITIEGLREGLTCARVRVSKPQVFADCDLVSVEVHAQRSGGAT